MKRIPSVPTLALAFSDKAHEARAILEMPRARLEELPAEEAGVALVVSALVRLAVPHRRDVFSPGELVRGTDGQPVGCRGLEGSL